jgi:hypothetical protein
MEPKFVRANFKPDLSFSLAVLSSLIVFGLLLLAMNKFDRSVNMYSWLTFLYGPLLAGGVSGAVGNWSQCRPKERKWTVSLTVLVAGTVVSLCFLFEGVICIVMAAPIIVPLHAAGYALGRHQRCNSLRSHSKLMVSLIPLILVFGVYSSLKRTDRVERIQTTEVLIDALPEEIWPLLFEMESIGEPDTALFRAGVAHPVKIRSEGEFLGAGRECVLSTGVMHEQISILERNRFLRFEVLNTPPSMVELNPFGEVRAQHLSGFFEVEYGEFKMEVMPDGMTKLLGTSRYSHQFYPDAYWSLWTDKIVDDVHRRVMNRMKSRAEGVG